MKNVLQDENSVLTPSGRNRYARHKPCTRDALKQRDQANARERIRTHSVNVAFSSLRSLLPSMTPERKLSKIEILRMARGYISHLSSLLNRLSEKLDYESGSSYSTECYHSNSHFCSSPISQTSIDSAHHPEEPTRRLAGAADRHESLQDHVDQSQLQSHQLSQSFLQEISADEVRRLETQIRHQPVYRMHQSHELYKIVSADAVKNLGVESNQQELSLPHFKTEAMEEFQEEVADANNPEFRSVVQHTPLLLSVKSEEQMMQQDYV